MLQRTATPRVVIDPRAAARQSLHNKIKRQEEARERDSVPAERAAATRRLPDQAIKLWLIDTGCGHDLVSRRELSAIKHMIRLAKDVIVLHTANGKAVARDTIDLFVKELGPTVEPYVLD